MRYPPPLRDRLMAGHIIGPSGCWIWQMRIDPRGYGRISVGSRSRRVHRVAYEEFVGPIQEGLVVDHTCHNQDPGCPGGVGCLHRRCINPDHLEATTDKENILAGRSPSALHAAKTHCPRGHPYDEENTYVDPLGRRHCRECRSPE